jgi:ribonuclease III
MTDDERARVATLESRIGHTFSDPEVALVSLTHKSWVNEHRDAACPDNERLEFLGDAVVDLAVSQRLMERLPDAREGTLSRMRAALVNADALAAVAQRLDLGELLRLGRGEDLTGGRTKTSLLSNCLEAIIGAIYVTGGYAPILDLVDRHLVPLLEELEIEVSGGRDYKTRVQERIQSTLGATPRYRVVDETGPDHAKSFTVELVVDASVLGRGEGRSKKEAEQQAARDALGALTESPEERVDTGATTPVPPDGSAPEGEKT